MWISPNIAKILWDSYQEIPEQTAITLLFNHAPDVALTYRQLIHSSIAYTQLLSRAGVKPGEVVILILQHGQDLVSAFLGTILLGAIPSIMPFLTEKLQPDHYHQALRLLFEITAPAAVITYPEFLSEVHTPAKTAKSIRQVIVSDQAIPIDEIDVNLLSGVMRGPSDIALLQHSSGTTGLQKGIALSHQAVFNQLVNYSHALSLKPDDVIVSWLPLYHDMGLIAGFILPLLSRVRLVLMSPFDWVRAPYRLLWAISRFQGTLCWLPNFAYNFCAQKIRSRDIEGISLNTMRGFINCSEPMDWKSHQQFIAAFRSYGLQETALATCYAMAENVFAVTQGGINYPVKIDRIDRQLFTQTQIAHPVEPTNTGRASPFLTLLSAGSPIENTAVRIINDTGDECNERQVGEIIIRSNCMLNGYYRRPDLTREAFYDGWYVTGDLGYLAEGELFVTGRKKDLIIVGGKNIYPQDLENLACEIEGVHPGRVVAFGDYNEVLGTEEVVLIAEVTDFYNQPEFTLDELKNEIRKHVTQGSDIALRNVWLVEPRWLLKTSSGKIARTANRDKYQRVIKGELDAS